MKRHWSLLRLLVVAAPFLIHLGTGSFEVAFGAPPLPTWTVVATLAAAAAAVVLALHDHRRFEAATRKVPLLLTAVLVLLVSPLTLVALFLLIDILAPLAAVPYAFAAVAAARRGLHRWQVGRDPPPG